MAQSAAALQVTEVPFKRHMRPIDLVHLAKQCLGDEQLEHEILRMFDATIKTYFERLVAADAPEPTTHALHAIRGAASGVGAFTVAEIAASAEADLREGRALGNEVVADLAHAIEEVRTFIERVLSSETA